MRERLPPNPASRHRGQYQGLRADRRIAVASLVISLALALNGCAAMVAVVTSKAMLSAGIASFVLTGKGLGDHALDLMTRKDCRILDAVLRESRGVCEEYGSPATDGDFTGVLAYQPGPPTADGSAEPDPALTMAGPDEVTP